MISNWSRKFTESSSILFRNSLVEIGARIVAAICQAHVGLTKFGGPWNIRGQPLVTGEREPVRKGQTNDVCAPVPVF